MKRLFQFIIIYSVLIFTGCKVPKIVQVENKQVVPPVYNNNVSVDTTKIQSIKWKDYFEDPYLIDLIDTALKNNYELLSTLQNIEIANNNIRIKHAALLPKIDAAIGLGIEKAGRYTAAGAGNASTDMLPGKKVPEPLGDIFLGFKAGWEVDIWNKLHNAEKAAYVKYLQSIEGKNFLVTNLVAEIANSYYELLALDNQLDVIKQAIDLQNKQLEILKAQKEAAKATELAVKQFEAQVYNSQSLQYEILQNITEVENKINYLLGRFPTPIARDSHLLEKELQKNVKVGIPLQLLQNRPDIKAAEYELEAAKLEVKIARAEFFPSVNIGGIFGLQGYKPKFVLPSLESMAFKLAGEMVAPIINRNAIQAQFKSANAAQLGALYEYQKNIVNGYMEVYNQMANIQNLEKYYDLKSKQAQTLTKSLDVSKELYKYARADYMEVLSVQREALATKLELVEARKNQFIAVTNIYKALGGGWR